MKENRLCHTRHAETAWICVDSSRALLLTREKDTHGLDSIVCYVGTKKVFAFTNEEDKGNENHIQLGIDFGEVMLAMGKYLTKVMTKPKETF